MLEENILKRLQAELREKPSHPTLDPILKADAASEIWTALGMERLSQGKVACLILAGGQGSRLKTSLPKALIPVTPDGKKTLLELQLEKIGTAPCAIITSPGNHNQIAQFLEDHPFPSRPVLVTQTEAPFLTDEGNWILRENGKLAAGPDGNGHALHLLEAHGVLDTWNRLSVEEISITQIDNALANPVDPILIGYHVAHPADVTVKVIQRESPHEKVGVMVVKDGRIEVQEYSERAETGSQEALAHIGLFAINLSFAKKVSQIEFPWHRARKQDPVTGEWIWKFERFIFDMLSYSEKTNLLLYPRKEVYAPLKNASGEKSLETVRKALATTSLP